MSEKYTYKDFATGKIKYTRGKFIGWSEPTGPLNVKYAGFKRAKTLLWVPNYLLTREAREKLARLTESEK